MFDQPEIGIYARDSFANANAAACNLLNTLRQFVSVGKYPIFWQRAFAFRKPLFPWKRWRNFKMTWRGLLSFLSHFFSTRFMVLKVVRSSVFYGGLDRRLEGRCELNPVRPSSVLLSQEIASLHQLASVISKMKSLLAVIGKMRLLYPRAMAQGTRWLCHLNYKVQKTGSPFPEAIFLPWAFEKQINRSQKIVRKSETSTDK